MTVIEKQAKTLLTKHKKIDSWFISAYGMNIYRGCLHNCAYCDGRAEGYFVDGEFGSDISVKINAPELLIKELSNLKKKNQTKKGFILVGGGVCDSFQPIEKQYELSRKCLEIIKKYDLPVHMLTKSTLIKKDIDVLQQINQKTRAIVSFSFSSANDEISRIFEPGVPPPSERFETIRYFKNQGLICGMYLMPVIPFITDVPEILEETIAKAHKSGVDFIIFGGMTLKEGRQKEYFIKVLEKHYPGMAEKYEQIYYSNKWGMAKEEYYQEKTRLFYDIVRKYKIPVRIPLKLYADFLNENDKVIVMLEHLDYLAKLRNEKSPYGFAAYSISQLNRPLAEIKNELTSLRGVGPFTERIILEILNTGTSGYYEKMISS